VKAVTPHPDPAIYDRNKPLSEQFEGVDSFILRPADLSISLGIPMQFEHAKFQEAIRTVIRAGQAAGKPLVTAVYGGDEWMLTASCLKLVECVGSLRS
jgi:hypothetical protein